MKNIAQWKLWVIVGCTTICGRFFLEIDWGYSASFGIIIAVLVQLFINRSVKKHYKFLIEDNYTMAKEFGYTITQIYRESGLKSYILEKDLEKSQSKVSIKININRGGVSFHYTPIDEIDMVHLHYGEDHTLSLIHLESIEDHALGKRKLRPKLI